MYVCMVFLSYLSTFKRADINYLYILFHKIGINIFDHLLWMAPMASQLFPRESLILNLCIGYVAIEVYPRRKLESHEKLCVMICLLRQPQFQYLTNSPFFSQDSIRNLRPRLLKIFCIKKTDLVKLTECLSYLNSMATHCIIGVITGHRIYESNKEKDSTFQLMCKLLICVIKNFRLIVGELYKKRKLQTCTNRCLSNIFKIWWQRMISNYELRKLTNQELSTQPEKILEWNMSC